MDIGQVVEKLPAIDKASAAMLSLFGPQFTKTKNGHIETDISAAASLAGMFVLRSKVPAIQGMKPGTLILSPMEAEMNLIMNFVTGMCDSLGIDPSKGWDTHIPKEHMPLMSIPDMTRPIEKECTALCSSHGLDPDYYPFVAALASLRLVAAGRRMKILDQNLGKALIWYHVYGAARTVPYPEDG